MTESTELWLAHPDYVGYYEVSDCGQVRSVDRLIHYRDGKVVRYRGVILTQGRAKDDRPVVTLSVNNRRVTRLVYQLVLETFVGPCPPGMEACHWDNNVRNSHLLNLRWDTGSANTLDQVRHGTHLRSRRTHCPLTHLLAAPNLVPSSLAWGLRACLACNRTHNNARRARERGAVLDFRAVADEHYRRIMSVAV